MKMGLYMDGRARPDFFDWFSIVMLVEAEAL